MAYRVGDGCIGCGACEFACPTAAISQTADFPVTFVVDPLGCDDCARCVVVCPVDVLAPDPAWAVCNGRGCPLSSLRYAGWECSRGAERCRRCGSMLWRPPGGAWVCSRCRLGEDGRGASCPKVRQAERSGYAVPRAG
ncbi:MAG: 4Fe-4S binding protein [Actinomycetota bacterium]|nr:4Fe-4S binding protein [Actinomycetota bacterium]